MARQRQRLVPLTTASIIRAFGLGAAPQLTHEERRLIAERHIATLTDAQLAAVTADRNRQLMSMAELKVSAMAIKLNGPSATVPQPVARRSRAMTEAEMERRGW